MILSYMAAHYTQNRNATLYSNFSESYFLPQARFSYVCNLTFTEQAEVMLVQTETR